MVEWRLCPSFPNHEVSEDGRVRNAVALRTRSRHHLLRGGVEKGYLRYQLSLPDGSKHLVGAHALVCEAWHGPKPTPEHEPAHWDGNRLNNHFANLRWATKAENAADRVRHGTNSLGERNGFARLSDREVSEIIAAPRSSYGWQGRLAREYGVSPSLISKLLGGKTPRAAEALAQKIAARKAVKRGQAA